MKKIILVVLLLSALSGCQLGKPKIEKQLYQMQDQSVFLTVQLGKHAEVKQLKMKTMYSSKGWMKQQNMTLDEAEQALNEQFNRRQDLILALQERGSLCNACEIELESDQAIGSSFTDVVHENKTPHVLYEETVLIDLQKIKEFDHDILAVFSEYHIPIAKQDSTYVLHLDALLADTSFAFSDALHHGAMSKAEEDGAFIVVKEATIQEEKRIEVPFYEFMDIPLVAKDFEGTQYRAKFDDLDDAMIVPWNYCIEGEYQSMRTSYWSRCDFVSARVYDMFGDYHAVLPQTDRLEYTVVDSGYYVRIGVIQTASFLELLEQTDRSVEIPTPFDLYRFPIGYGYDGIELKETRADGSVWEYHIDIADEAGFYMAVTKDSSIAYKTSFTYFYGGKMEAFYQELMKSGKKFSG